MSELDRMSEHHECGEDAAAYALGALDQRELSSFLAHLEQCSVCQAEVESFTGVVRALPMAAVQYKAPRHLRRRLMRSVKQSSPELAGVREPGFAAARQRVSQWVTGVRLAGAGAALTLAAVGAALAGVFSTGGATLIQAQVMGIRGTAQLKVQNGHAELVVSHMTSPGRRHVYEVWLKSGAAAPVPASVLFSVDSAGNADVSVPEKLSGTESVLVTKEPLGGTPAPTTSPVISATATVD